jgi:Eukaryotic protein of unknown function (DUF829)
MISIWPSKSNQHLPIISLLPHWWSMWNNKSDRIVGPPLVKRSCDDELLHFLLVRPFAQTTPVSYISPLLLCSHVLHSLFFTLAHPRYNQSPVIQARIREPALSHSYIFTPTAIRTMEGHNDSLSAQDFFVQAPSIWVRHPKRCSTTSSISSGQSPTQNTPNMILFFSWTSASPRPISKYTTDYIELFPDVPIMVVTTTLSDLAFRSEHHKQQVLAPAVEYITSRHLDLNIHVHCFSEGGSHKSIQFTKAFLAKTGKKLPVTSLCLDSTSGDHQYHRIARAFRLSLPPNCLLWALGLMFAYLMLTFLWCFYAIYGPNKNLMTRIRRGLEDQRLWDTEHIPRCYLYSKNDTLIKWQDVEKHARKAEDKGVPVLLATFQDSNHCHHVREDGEKYWSAVRWTLQRSGATNEGEEELEKEATETAGA